MAGSIISIFGDSANHPDPWNPKEEELFPERIFKKGVPLATEAAETTFEALERIGVTCDQSARKQIIEECTLLAEIGYDGRIYPKITSIPEGENDPRRILEVAAGASHASSRTISANEIPQMRIAFFRREDSSGVDPILHYLNLSFSRHAQGGNSSIYQPQAFNITKETFEKSFGKNKWSLDLATPDEVLVWIIMDRVRGIPVESSNFILFNGLMRLPTRFYGNYNSTSFDIHDAISIENGEIGRQTCDAVNWPFIGYGGVVAFRP